MFPRIFRRLCVGILCLIVQSVVLPGLEAATRRVLFVGNSLTHRIREADLPVVVPDASVTIDPHFHTNCG